MAKSNQTKKYAYLSRLSTKELESILRADAESLNTVNDEAISYILEVIEQREHEHPSGSFPDVDSSWKEFQIIYNTPEGADRSLYPAEDEDDLSKPANLPKSLKRRREFRRPLIIAAIIVLLIASMTIPVAGHGNLLEVIGSWTADQFTFIVTRQHRNSDLGEADTSKANISDPQAGGELRQVLQEHGITETVVPSWLPDGFELIGEVSVQEYPDFGKVDFYATYSNGSDSCTMSITQSFNSTQGYTYEKISGEPEIYVVENVEHYIIQNSESIMAAWHCENLETSITATFSKSDLERVIDSIYQGVVNQ